MKKLTLLLTLTIFVIQLSAQSNLDSLIEIGVAAHDSGNYQRAIKIYQKALEINSNSSVAHYEIAYTYMALNDLDNAIKHSDIVINYNDDNLLGAYLVKSSCLDYQGKVDESISLLEKAIKKFKDHYLLYYNLALSYYNKKETEKSEENLIAAIKLNHEHSSSHLLLSSIMFEKQKKVQGILCIYYFLFLEPNTARAKTAYETLRAQMGGNVSKSPDKPNQINITMNVGDKNDEFRSAEVMLSLLEASKTTEANKGKSDEEMFAQNTQAFFKFLGERKDKKSKGLCWELYVPFFSDIANSDHTTTFCNYISFASNEKSKEWIEKNNDKLQAFSVWLDAKNKK